VEVEVDGRPEGKTVMLPASEVRLPVDMLANPVLRLVFLGSGQKGSFLSCLAGCGGRLLRIVCESILGY